MAFENDMVAVGHPARIARRLRLPIDIDSRSGLGDLAGGLIDAQHIQFAARRSVRTRITAVRDPASVRRPAWPSCFGTAGRDLPWRLRTVCKLQEQIVALVPVRMEHDPLSVWRPRHSLIFRIARLENAAGLRS